MQRGCVKRRRRAPIFENVFCRDLCQRAARLIYYSLARTCPLIREHQTGAAARATHYYLGKSEQKCLFVCYTRRRMSIGLVHQLFRFFRPVVNTSVESVDVSPTTHHVALNRSSSPTQNRTQIAVPAPHTICPAFREAVSNIRSSHYWLQQVNISQTLPASRSLNNLRAGGLREGDPSSCPCT